MRIFQGAHTGSLYIVERLSVTVVRDGSGTSVYNFDTHADALDYASVHGPEVVTRRKTGKRGAS